MLWFGYGDLQRHGAGRVYDRLVHGFKWRLNCKWWWQCNVVLTDDNDYDDVLCTGTKYDHRLRVGYTLGGNRYGECHSRCADRRKQ